MKGGANMLSIDLQARIFKEYHTGKEFTNGRKYRYTLQYNPLALVHTWVIRQDKSGGAWEWVHPLSCNMQFTPVNSVRKALKACI